ncbi:hypothetical protein BJ878DRAFT_431158 [Calycina marina]|uniref:Ubiquitin-like protease family profile domain-containing protein n=1 Tax=Calycina marina TaxID=1763456 RepID=A0A9P7YUJ4_9HELO|nr:hypothetical protein BJ878DRAFT_431158 [Calycina marina]
MTRRQEAPGKVHSRILSTLRASLGGTLDAPAVTGGPDSVWVTSNSTSWSASMWINMLEAGHARSREVTILNMIEWIGASDWYDAELEQAEKAPPLTKRGVPRKRLATVVLDKYLKEARKRLNKIFHRGRTLRRLVQMTHLGILFDPDIWSYAKASKENVDKIAALFQADSRKMDLLSILDEQVELLANEGQPDLSRFFDSLEVHSIIPPEEVSSLRAEYGLEREPVPQGCLDTAIDRVVDKISLALGKNPLGQDDSIFVNGAVELPDSMFDRFRFKEWLTCWDIAAALDMTDRPASVRLSLSIPLHEEDADGEITTLSNLFSRWRQQIDEYRRESEADLRSLQVYRCPLNIHANHFTLLEINEQTKMIYHYDSLASHKVIHRKVKSTSMRRVIQEEFKYLGFGYLEVPTPQQKDGWSCGSMVIRNAKRRMRGLSVGTWEDEVNPDRVIKEVVGDCQKFLEDDALQPVPLSKKRKIVTAFQVSSRSSKSLEGITEDSQMGL